MTFAPFRIGTGPIFDYLKFLNVTQIFRLETSKFVFKSKKNLLPISTIVKYFERQTATHRHNLRSINRPSLITPYVLLSSSKKKSLYIKGTYLWREMPEPLKSSDSFNIFKKDLKLLILQDPNHSMFSFLN